MNALTVPLADADEELVAVAISADHPDDLSTSPAGWTGHLADHLETLWLLRNQGSCSEVRAAANRLHGRIVSAQWDARRAAGLALGGAR